MMLLLAVSWHMKALGALVLCAVTAGLLRVIWWCAAGLARWRSLGLERALAGARVVVHGVRRVPAPVLEENTLQEHLELAGDGDAVLRGFVKELWDAEELHQIVRRRTWPWYLIDLTVEPELVDGRYQPWAPLALSLIPEEIDPVPASIEFLAGGKQLENSDDEEAIQFGYCEIVAMKSDDREWAEDSFILDGPVEGPLRLQLVVGLHPDYEVWAMKYLGVAFGRVEVGGIG